MGSLSFPPCFIRHFGAKTSGISKFLGSYGFLIWKLFKICKISFNFFLSHSYDRNNAKIFLIYDDVSVIVRYIILALYLL
jgi:hypothetical protein